MHPQPLLYESHLHTPLCKHAVGTPSEYAQVAQQKNLKGIIVTCHNPIPDGYAASVRMRIEELETYLGMVATARETFAGKVDVRLGLECDYAPGMEAWLEDLLQRAPFEYVLGSIHPHIKDYREQFDTGDAFAYQQIYFEHLAMAAETGFFDTLAHPDLIKNIAPEAWDLERIMPTIRKALDRIAKTGVAMELNTSGRNKKVEEVNPGAAILKEMAARKIPVILGADAHTPERVADFYPEALDMLATAGYEHVYYALNKQRTAIPIEVAKESLRKPF